jgi:uncharacterized repeat protein (TIGR03837 family)
MGAMQLHWDIFCRVIDNHGDIGVCWRLARQLASEHEKVVRLWLDDFDSLKPMSPAVDLRLNRQICEGVEICRWTENIAVDRPAEVVIETFACDLPASYLQAMAGTLRKPCWINLEYLTAESWAEGCHGLASPHPSLPLVKYFYFPGFTAASGGLLREKDLLTRRDAEVAGLKREHTLDVSLFCYDNAPVDGLLTALGESASAIRLHVAAGKPLAAVARHLKGSGPWQIGQLQVLPFDFLPQDDFDRLLWRCDINFVRGEDSFVRAQWAGKPFVWQIYPQAEQAHLDKLEAFLARYTEGMSTAARIAAVNVFRAWNSVGDLRCAWEDFMVARAEIAGHSLRWSEQLAEDMDLSTALVKFCAAKV